MNVSDQLTLLSACLCTQITADKLPEPCFCGVIPGDGVAFDYAGDCTKKCGMAWVRLTTLYPASGVGIPNENVKNCASGLGFEAEVGIIRCTPIGTAETPPSASQLRMASDLQVADALAARRAVACCDGSDDWILGAYTSVGPIGGMLGGFWNVTMWIP